VTTTVEIGDRIAKCQKILDADPNSQIFAALAEAYRRSGDLEKAFRVCQNGLKIHPSYGSAHVVMAKINLDRRLYDWAEIEARKAAELDGWTRATELLLAEIHIYKGEFVEALRLLKKLHAADPTNTQTKKLLEIARQLPQQQAAGIRSQPEPPAESESDQSAAPPPPAAPPAPERRADLLARSLSIPGVEGAVFVNAEGLLVDSQWTLDLDASICSAVMAEIGNRVNSELASSVFGAVNTVWIETGGPTFLVIRGDDGFYLFAGDATANLGALRMKLEGLLHEQA
jgi:predicted regulator of Ras-like GTPase activity (Roadblock/LC7/MglB family)